MSMRAISTPNSPNSLTITTGRAARLHSQPHSCVMRVLLSLPRNRGWLQSQVDDSIGPCFFPRGNQKGSPAKRDDVLSHWGAFKKAEGVGLEPTLAWSTTVFETAPQCPLRHRSGRKTSSLVREGAAAAPCTSAAAVLSSHRPDARGLGCGECTRSSTDPIAPALLATLLAASFMPLPLRAHHAGDLWSYMHRAKRVPVPPIGGLALVLFCPCQAICP